MAGKRLALSLWLTTCIPFVSLSRGEGPLERKVHDLACIELKKLAQGMNLLIPEGTVRREAVCNLPWDPMSVTSLKHKYSGKTFNFNEHHNVKLIDRGVVGQKLVLSGGKTNVLSTSAHIGDLRYELISGVVQLSNFQPYKKSYHTFTACESGITLTIDGIEYFKSYQPGRSPCFSPLKMERDEYVLPSRIKIGEGVFLDITYLYGIYQDVGPLKLPSYDIRPLNVYDIVDGDEIKRVLEIEAFDPRLYMRGICLLRLVQLLRGDIPHYSFENPELEDINIQLQTLNDDAGVKEKTKSILLKACSFIFKNSDDLIFTHHSLLRILGAHEPTMKNSIILKAQYEPKVDFYVEEKKNVNRWSGIQIYYRPKKVDFRIIIMLTLLLREDTLHLH